MPKKFITTHELIYSAHLAFSRLSVVLFFIFHVGKVVILNYVNQKNFIFSILYYVS